MELVRDMAAMFFGLFVVVRVEARVEWWTN